MEAKPKSVKLVNFEEEQLPTGRKLLHCIFQNRYGTGFQYKWTAPWRDKEGEYGVQRLFFKCLGTEEWNDYDSVWSEELRKVAKEVPSLEELALPVKIEVGGVSEDVEVVETDNEQARSESLLVHVNVLSGEERVEKHIESGREYMKVGCVSMAWEFLESALRGVRGVDSVSNGIRQVTLQKPDGNGGYVPVWGISFGVRIYRTANRNEYEVISREIASCIRRFIRRRLSEYKTIKRGFEENN